MTRDEEPDMQLVACASCGHLATRDIFDGEALDPCAKCGDREVARG